MVINSGADMLISTRASLDKIEGFRNESFEDEEIQLYLNKSQFRLLDDLTNKNFQQGTIRYEWLRKFQKELGPPIAWGPTQYTAVALYPSDLYYLISARVQIQINTAVYNPDGVQKKCLNDIDDTGLDPDLTYTEIQQLDMQETGETIDKEHNWFYGENYRNPRAEMVALGVRLYRGRKYLINNVVFDYIVKPEEIDVSSPPTQTLLWPTSALEKIIDYTVEYMRLTIEDPAFEGNVQDFNIRTQNA